MRTNVERAISSDQGSRGQSDRPFSFEDLRDTREQDTEKGWRIEY